MRPVAAAGLLLVLEGELSEPRLDLGIGVGRGTVGAEERLDLQQHVDAEDLSCRVDKPNRLGYFVVTMQVRNLLKLLATDGWVQTSQRGSHRQFEHPTKPGKVTVPGHPGDEIPRGTLNGIRRQAGLEE